MGAVPKYWLAHPYRNYPQVTQSLSETDLGSFFCAGATNTPWFLRHGSATIFTLSIRKDRLEQTVLTQIRLCRTRRRPGFTMFAAHLADCKHNSNIMDLFKLQEKYDKD